jgi:hypothetical protein
MKKSYLLLLFCATLLSPTGDLFAQNLPPSLRAEIGAGTPAPTSLLASHQPQVFSDSTLVSPPTASPGKEPADIDPGIWLKPDSTIDVKIMLFIPRADVDPKMILPTLPKKRQRK